MVLPFKRNLFGVLSHGAICLVNDVVLTFESVDEVLWCYHSNETSSTELLIA